MKKPQNSLTRVFVYGTLKRGYHNHRLLGGSVLESDDALTALKFPLHVDGLPYLFDEPGAGLRVYGETYLVDAPTLADLDRLEGHPRFYRRREIDVKLGAVKVTAWVYFIQTETSESFDTAPVNRF